MAAFAKPLLCAGRLFSTKFNLKNEMKSAFFIMQMWQTGNIGSHNIKKLNDNPKEGYGNYNEAKHAMLDLWEKDNWELKKGGYVFAIMELYW